RSPHKCPYPVTAAFDPSMRDFTPVRHRVRRYSHRMPWTDHYAFDEPWMDLGAEAASEVAARLSAELAREIGPGHELHGRSWKIVAQAVPQDDVIVECDGRVAVVHLTWARHPEPPGWPAIAFVNSPGDLESFVHDRY